MTYYACAVRPASVHKVMEDLRAITENFENIAATNMTPRNNRALWNNRVMRRQLICFSIPLVLTQSIGG